jgi:hypothetical protein
MFKDAVRGSSFKEVMAQRRRVSDAFLSSGMDQQTKKGGTTAQDDSEQSDDKSAPAASSFQKSRKSESVQSVKSESSMESNDDATNNKEQHPLRPSFITSGSVRSRAESFSKWSQKWIRFHR